MPRRRMKTTRGDWVYRGREYDDDGGPPDLNSGPSYEWAERSLGVGQPNGSLVILYDSQNYLTQSVARDAAGNDYSLPMAARAAQRRPLLHEVEGIITYRPSNWAIGSLMLWGWRLIVAEQDPEDGAALLDANYTMFDPAAGSSPNEDSTRGRTRRACSRSIATGTRSATTDRAGQLESVGRASGVYRRTTPSSCSCRPRAVPATPAPIFRTYLRTRVSDDTG